MDKELKFFLWTLNVKLDAIISMLSQISSEHDNGKELSKQISSLVYGELEKIKEEIEKGE